MEHNLTGEKIPTVLYYDQYQNVVGWGTDIAEALAPTGYPKQGVQKVCTYTDARRKNQANVERKKECLLC